MSFPRAARRRRLIVPWLFLMPTVLLFGCGDETSEPAPRDSAPPSPEGLVATMPDGNRVTLEPIKAECVPSEYDHHVQVVQVTAAVEETKLMIHIVPSEDEGRRSFDLPLDPGSQDTGPANALVYISMRPNLETSSAVEGATGDLEVARASCEPLEVELTIDATLGSEYGDGQPIKIHGRLRFPR